METTPEKIRDKNPTDFFYHTDNFQLSYLAAGLWEDSFYRGTIIVGPFLSDVPDDAFISNIIERNKLSLSHRQQLNQLYYPQKVTTLKRQNCTITILPFQPKNHFIYFSSWSIITLNPLSISSLFTLAMLNLIPFL